MADCTLDPKKGIARRHPVPEAVVLTVLERVERSWGKQQNGGCGEELATPAFRGLGTEKTGRRRGTTAPYLDTYPANTWKENL